MTDEKIFLKPARADLMVRFPENPARVLAAEGEYVIDSPAWHRLIRFGDVAQVQKSVPEDESTAKKGAK